MRHKDARGHYSATDAKVMATDNRNVQQVSPSKDHKSLTPVNQSKTCTMVAKSHEDGEEAFTSVNVERPRPSGISMKSSSDGLTNNDEVKYRAACRAQSNDGHTYIGVGRLNGQPVKVLRDTGCTGMIVDRALIPDSMVIPGSSGSLLANVYLDSPHFKGHCRVMCVSSPVYPVMIGNVRGARQILPDPDYKAEDQRKARARTGPMGATTMMMTTKLVICLVGCSERSPTETTLRIETRRRGQPSSRRTRGVCNTCS